MHSTITTPSPRVLSIQSHIVSGYCGNKAATFPLQLLGFDVDVLNTVNFSNHTGYPSWTGERVTGSQIMKLYEGLQINGLVEYTHLLTGYIGSAQNLTAVTKIISQLKALGDPFFVLDPVMGDNGQLYVHSDVIPLYRKLMKYADAITPNQFEAEVLTDRKITDIKSCLEAIDILHTAGVENVVITSVSLSPEDIAANTEGKSNEEPHGKQGEKADNLPMYCVCSSKEDQRVFAIGFPTYDGYFTGTGDLFSALLLARLDETLQETQASSAQNGIEQSKAQYVTPLAKASLKVVATMKAVVLRTFSAQKEITGKPIDKAQASSAAVVKRCELRLIQSKKDIEQPNEEEVVAIELHRV
ncbi:putative pyridoxal kinase [Lobosporangium transversale]|uniref:pyridoxal kinase n=1 Tax=Lobosporangium transversale TaxID=64571 RepID=A0A1Y2H0I6_9FUNG|nr:Ribokinase-like protein [Lobosporangium transversale]KAF9915273.1 putative pyridoxal kinase [Lobosporangium transversale]ORZ27521.1 Ribokinase-like protein [Lobosporangium transversale]|eukprot:XP_021885248.1 Ribokinase-like protein [Lobosporangium transversale]